jgi:DHA2 family multidrug resistance protein-like MFS transporter
VFALGLSPVASLATDLTVGSAPPERAGAASGLSETSAELGGALGVAVLGSIGTVVYRSMLPEALQATAVVSATVLAATVVLAVTLLRHARTGQPQPT